MRWAEVDLPWRATLIRHTSRAKGADLSHSGQAQTCDTENVRPVYLFDVCISLIESDYCSLESDWGEFGFLQAAGLSTSSSAR